jgi:hypothetical protein
LNTDHATTVAEATNVAIQLDAQGTERAELEAAATRDALSNADTDATVVALQQREGNAVATTESAEATADAANNEVLAAQEQAQLNTLDPNAVPQVIQVDLNGVISGDDEALDEARDELHRVLDPYANSATCRIGFVLISSRAPELGQGIQLSDAIAELIFDEFPGLLPTAAEGERPVLASESIALPNTTPSGEVELLLFLSAGCEPAAQVSPVPIAYIRAAR